MDCCCCWLVGQKNLFIEPDVELSKASRGGGGVASSSAQTKTINEITVPGFRNNSTYISDYIPRGIEYGIRSQLVNDRDADATITTTT